MTMADDASKHQQAGEAPIDEMLADPVVNMLMKRDGVSQDEILRVLRCVRHARTAYDHMRSIPPSRSY